MAEEQESHNQIEPLANKTSKVGKTSYTGYSLPPEIANYSHTGDEIDRARQAWRGNQSDYYRKIQEFMEKDNPYKKRGFEELAELYAAKNGDFLNTMKKFEDRMLPRNFRSSELGLSYAQRQRAKKNLFAAENQYLYQNKNLGIPTGTILDKIATDHGLDLNQRRKIREIILLDDPVTKAKELISKYGIPISEVMEKVFPAYPRWVTKVLMALVGNPTSVVEEMTKPKPNGLTKDLIVSHLTNQDYLRPDTVQPAITNNETAFDTTAFDGLATIICPEKYRFRLYTQYPTKTALASGIMSVPITSDSTGNVLILINPLNSTAAAAGTAAAPLTGQFFIASLTGWVPNTGAYTNFSKTAGPLFTNAAAIRSGKISGFSIQFTPTVSSLNNQGLNWMSYIENYNAFSYTSGSADLQLSSIQLSPYTQEIDEKNPIRGIYLPDNTDSLDPDTATNIFADGFILAVTNTNPSTTIGTLDISYVYEVMPQQNSQNIMPLQSPTPGPSTTQAMATAILKNLSLQMLPLPKAVCLARKIFSVGVGLKYQEAVKLLTESEFEHKSTKMRSAMDMDHQDMSILSFE
jgi:hypothetical protein